MVVYGRSTDELFVRFTQAKEDMDISTAKDILNEINNMPVDQQKFLASLYADVEDYINDMEYDEMEM